MKRPRNESGFTVLELTIVMMISAVVMATFAGILDSQSKAERRVNTLAANQEQVRLALVAIQQDLRSAEPLVPLADITKYPTQMEIIHADFDTDVTTRLRWRFDSTKQELVRETLSTSGTVTATTFRLTGVTGKTTFRYFNASGDELVPDPTAQTSATIAGCTVKVRVLIDAAPQSGPNPLTNWSEVQLRNRRPGGAGC